MDVIRARQYEAASESSMLVTNFDVESARVVRRRCVAADDDDDDGGDARRAVEVVESTIRYVRREWRMANGADGSIATMVMMGLGAIDRFGGGGVRRVRA